MFLKGHSTTGTSVLQLRGTLHAFRVSTFTACLNSQPHRQMMPKSRWLQLHLVQAGINTVKCSPECLRKLKAFIRAGYPELLGLLTANCISLMLGHGTFCVLNDIIDARIDAKVARTKNRRCTATAARQLREKHPAHSLLRSCLSSSAPQTLMNLEYVSSGDSFPYKTAFPFFPPVTPNPDPDPDHDHDPV